MKHFAVETLGNTSLRVVEAVVRAAASSGYSFTLFESLDRVKVGSTEFQRFRMKGDPSALLETLFTGGRGTISPDCLVRLKSRNGKVPFTLLLAAPREQKVYRGPGDPYWERQFD